MLKGKDKGMGASRLRPAQVDCYPPGVQTQESVVPIFGVITDVMNI